MRKQLFSGLALLVLVAVQAGAQESGQIVGTVHDQTGALVPGVKVAATETGTGLARSALTGTDGEYVLPNLRPTTYIITAEASGFRTFRQTEVELLANQSLTLNVGMEVGAVTETINVSGQTVQVDTSTSTLAEVVDRARIIELPL